MSKSRQLAHTMMAETPVGEISAINILYSVNKHVLKYEIGRAHV